MVLSVDIWSYIWGKHAMFYQKLKMPKCFLLINNFINTKAPSVSDAVCFPNPFLKYDPTSLHIVQFCLVKNVNMINR